MPAGKQVDTVQKDISRQEVRDLRLLAYIEDSPDTTQADLAGQLGVAVGTVNWHVRRMVTRGLIKVSQLQRRRLRYLITPKGIAEKTRLAYRYAWTGMALYRTTRAQAQGLLSQLRRSGYEEVCLDGDGDVIDVCRLTCIEMQLSIRVQKDARVPVLRVAGDRLSLEYPDEGRIGGRGGGAKD
jgi:DNA-binding MarR family transcriptional regulator